MLGSRPRVRIRIEEGGDQVDGRTGERVVHLGWQLVVRPSDLAVELLICGAAIREAAAKDGKEEDSEGPDVSWRSAVFRFVDDLGCHVGRRAAEYFDLLLVGDARAEAEIDDLDIVVVVEEQVLKLDIAMRDAPVMAVADALNDLLEDALGLLLFKSAVRLGLEVAVQAATTHELHDQDHVLGGVDHLVQANDVLVTHFLHQLDLSLDTLPAVGVEELGLLVDFHGDLFVRGAMQSDAHHSVGALPDLLANDIVVK